MFSIMAGLIYVAAIAIPIWLLYRYRSKAWYWHVLALIAAGVVGLAPATPLLETTAGTFVYGFVFFVAAVWGIGGLIPIRSRRQKLA